MGRLVRIIGEVLDLGQDTFTKPLKRYRPKLPEHFPIRFGDVARHNLERLTIPSAYAVSQAARREDARKAQRR